MKRRRPVINGECGAYWVIGSCGWSGGPYTTQTIASDIAATLRPLYPDRRFQITSERPS